ncbi:MAG: pre-peptidase C-terminal domain-containing protein [Shimia sp.]|uniref:calcium-binding protein n=1 Tax=Shimia sp. TaxID=1954381 RepID=UPI003B8E141C
MTLENTPAAPLNAPAPDIGHTPATAQAIDVGETITSTFTYAGPFEPRDYDMFAVTLEAGKIYEFSFDYTDDSGHTILNYYTFQIDLYRYSYNADTDTYTREEWYETEGANIPLLADVTDTYYIRAEHFSWSINESVDYTFTVNEIFDDFGGTIAEATAAEVGTEFSGSIDYRYDVDMFAVTLTAGETYSIDVTPGDGDGLDYIPLSILDADGNVIARTSASSLNRIELTISETATYYVSVEHRWGYGEDELNLTHLGSYTAMVTAAGEIFGDDTNQTINGTSQADVIHAAGGNDKVYARKGNDVVHLGDGNDYVRVGGGREEFHGGAGKDYISYYDSKNGVTINLATNEVSGSWAANDTISGFESVSGSRTGDDRIYGTSGANTIKTYGGNDKVYAGKGSDKVYLGDGNDYVKAGGGKEEFHGGNGIDYLSYYDSANGVTVNLSTNEVSGSWANNDVISGFENVSGSKTGHDTILGNSGANKIKTYGGNDVINSGGGNDKVYAGKGNDTVDLGSGNDYVKVGGGKESFDGGSGTDYISYIDSKNGITIDLRANTVSGSWGENDTIRNFEGASGSRTGADTMYGTDGSNTLKSYGGNDRLYGRGGSDKLDGGSGNDRLDGGSGNDRLYGGSGNDTLYGGTSGDNLYGGSGNDRLFGGSGNDTLRGDSGNDFIDGGSSNDELYGGSGADVFHFNVGDGNDTITDFENGIDKVEADGFRDLDGDGSYATIWRLGYFTVEVRFDNGQVLTFEDIWYDLIGNDDFIQL